MKTTVRDDPSQISWSKRIADLVRLRARNKRTVDTKKKVRTRKERIREQLVFYLSDSNLRRDSFMHEVFMKDPYGWLSAADLVHFPIMLSMKVSIPEVLDACVDTDFFVVERESARIRRNFEQYPNQEIMEILNRRSVPPPHQLSPLERRTIYIDGYPILTSQEKLRELIFEQFPDVKIDVVSIPKNPRTSEPYGGAFLEIDTEEHAKLLVKKLRWLKTSHVDFRTFVSSERCPVRVLTMGKFKALKTSYKASKSLAVRNRLEYFVGYRPDVLIPHHHLQAKDNRSSADAGGDSYDYRRILADDRERSYPQSEDDQLSNASSSSVLAMSDINSLAQDSVDVRRSVNASSIRSNSVVLIQNIPPAATIQQIRIWLSHHSAVQFLDYNSSACTAYARFASRRERDFFMEDFGNSRIPLLGKYPQIKVLSNDECLDYFEAERDRRRSTISSLGHPDAWTPRSKCQPSTGSVITTKIPVLSKRESMVPLVTNNSGIAFTDTIAGNSTMAEPGSSMLYGIHRGRHIARQEFRATLLAEKENIDLVQVVNEPRGLKRTRSGDSGLQEQDSSKRERLVDKKKTRRGKRGGVRARSFNHSN